LNSINFYFLNYTAFAIKYYPQKKSIASDLYNLRLATKGLIFNSNFKTRLKILASGDSSLLRKYEKEKSLRNYLAKVYSMSAAERVKKNIDEKQLEEQANVLEKELAEQTSKFEIMGLKEKTHTTWQDVKSKLKKNEAAIEIIKIKKKDDTVYVALILKSNIEDVPEMIELESGHLMEERSIHYYHNCIQNQIDDQKSYDVFWKLIASKLKGIKKIYFSADGVYHQINLATLKNPASGRYLGDELNIRLVGSTMELTETTKISKATRAELFGYPDYKGDGKNPIVDSNDRGYSAPEVTDDLSTGFSRYFNLQAGVPALPGTAKEVSSIDQLLKRYHVPEDLFIGPLASEKQIKSVRDPKILHIATHGFFIPTLTGKLNKHSSAMDQNSLLRSGLLLAGCEKSMQGFAPPEGEEDGILTAYEAMNLFLDETDLVVLSACETGLGSEENGEGIYGLQGAFQEAGARTILISLWKVDDTATQLLMSSFYEKYLRTGKEKESFIAAQKTVRSRYPQPYYWGAFVMMGE
jgi:CHAT domain-containing protein